MANLYITEYSKVGHSDILPIAREPAITTQNVSFTTATSSSAFNASTTHVRMVASADCYVLFGLAAGAADNNQQKLIADVEYFRGVSPGQGHSVSVYDGSS